MKNLLIVILSFITVFISNSRAYAFENEAKKQEIFYLQQQEKIINTDLQPFMIADNSTSRANVPQIAWIGSIFIMGLGQLLLGDLGRGFSFWLWFILGSIVLVFTIVGVVLIPLYFVILHVWSIIDAYNMANDLTFTRVKLSDNKKIKEALNILEKFSIADNSLKFQAISF